MKFKTASGDKVIFSGKKEFKSWSSIRRSLRVINIEELNAFDRIGPGAAGHEEFTFNVSGVFGATWKAAAQNPSMRAINAMT